jgi:hypothetical protein
MIDEISPSDYLMTSTIFEDFSGHAAPPGHVTFSVLNFERYGHSVCVASKEYPGVVRKTKAGLSDISAATVFKEAIKIIRRNAVCTGNRFLCEDDGLLYAFISAMLKHPDKRTRKSLTEGISDILKKSGGAHVILFMPPTGPSAWLIADPSINSQVH